jgi:hypothetical protein
METDFSYQNNPELSKINGKFVRTGITSALCTTLKLAEIYENVSYCARVHLRGKPSVLLRAGMVYILQNVLGVRVPD